MDCTATFTYLQWQDLYSIEKPYQVFSAVADNAAETTNLIFEDGPEELVHDVRGKEREFQLEVNGFAFRRQEFDSTWFLDAESIVSAYLPRLESLLRRELENVTKVYFFDWRIRRNQAIDCPVIDANDKMQHLLPARHVHIDQTPSAAIGRTVLHLPDQAEDLLQGRVRIINLWRPLCEVVQDRPLAICDLRSVSLSDLVEADHVRKHYNGSNYYLKQNSDYKWYYQSQQTQEEVTLIQMFDSSASGVSGCPHSSFELPYTAADVMKRESIEVRALIFSPA